MELKVKLYLIDEESEKFMGIGVLWLLEKVAEHSSLRKAAMSLGISYTKALAMVQNLERELGIAVLNRQKGGAQRSGATLTPFGHDFITRYRSFEQEAKRSTETSYEAFKADLGALIDQYDNTEERDDEQ
ncbi:MAG TPA: LysR family transcriptional regulator [Sphaerochaeta sp.]|jgi:molybdate transport system regulatory protein|nr:LysR family transcriptional regulator [Spirochaetota bacterium]NLV61690.1 LysR family transcriptional regulator [Spirochaetales bacterium]HOE84471.1 LysR family transcriptional regulator [Sphaerochaeta sp.]HOQ94238.1 LysR family transcriptional regulator [Sphaerochaeta sp.]HPK47062.1 LysR family transcriptional regulator [Sphaerochaeta sp.]